MFAQEVALFVTCQVPETPAVPQRRLGCQLPILLGFPQSPPPKGFTMDFSVSFPLCLCLCVSRRLCLCLSLVSQHPSRGPGEQSCGGRGQWEQDSVRFSPRTIRAGKGLEPRPGADWPSRLPWAPPGPALSHWYALNARRSSCSCLSQGGRPTRPTRPQSVSCCLLEGWYHL